MEKMERSLWDLEYGEELKLTYIEREGGNVVENKLVKQEHQRYRSKCLPVIKP